MKKHAYLIAANNNFRVLKVALKLIDDERNDIYLILDAKSYTAQWQIDEFKNCVKSSRLIICPEMVINWAGYSQIAAVLQLVKTQTEKIINICTFFKVRIYQ